jgi:hypothetical protein
MELPSVVPRGFPFVPSGGVTTDDEKENFTPRHCGSGGDVPGRDQTEPIAVVGFSLKFPQEATSSEAFWQMLMEGRSARTRIPSNRFNIDGFYHPDPQRQGSVRFSHRVTPELRVFWMSRSNRLTVERQRRPLSD